MTMRRAALAVLALVAAAAAMANAQGPSPQAASAAQGAATSEPAPAPNPAPSPEPASGGQPPSPPASPDQGAADKTDQLIEPPGFTYNPEGRRDPFVSLARRGADAGGGRASRPAGLAGLAVAEVTLRGTVRSREGFVAILQGADQRAYIVRPGDKMFDGTVRAVSQNDVVILQQVNDPLSLEKQREVRKVLRQAEAN
jgi:Tfp pilus assembly protein PilP